MRRLIASSLVVLSTLGEGAFAQQAVLPVTAAAATTVTKTAVALAQPLAPNTLQDGTAVKMRLGETLSSAHAKTGQQVSFEVVEDVAVEGVTVILKGAQALATVTDASTKKSMGRGGKLDVNVDSVRLIDGERVQLRAVEGGKGGGHVGAMTGAMVATAIVFFPAAPLFLFVHGKDITIPKGTEVTAFVQGDMKLDMAKMVLPGVPTTASSAASQLASLSNLSVESNIPGADIEVDGAFVGSTPSTVTVAPGQHTISVKKKGYANWSRAMNVSGNAVRLNADLEAKP